MNCQECGAEISARKLITMYRIPEHPCPTCGYEHSFRRVGVYFGFTLVAFIVFQVLPPFEGLGKAALIGLFLAAVYCSIDLSVLSFILRKRRTQ